MKANQPKSGGMAPASSARAGMARTRAEAPGRRARTGGPSGGGSKAGVYVPAINQTVPRQGYTAKTNPQNKGRVTGGPQSRKDVPKAALTALAMYPVAAGAAGVARIASAGRSAAAGARQGISSLGARPAAQAAPSAAKAAAPKAAAKPTTMRQIGGTKKGVRPETGSVRAPGSKTPMRPAKPTPGQKGTLTKYAKKKAEAASKGKRGKKK